MTTEVLPEIARKKAISTKPPRHMRKIGPETLAKAYNKHRFYEACASRNADPVDVLARLFADTKETRDIPLEKRADLALRALSWLDKTDTDEPLRETPRVEIIIVDPSARPAQVSPAITIETV